MHVTHFVYGGVGYTPFNDYTSLHVSVLYDG
jgi:hypothetical protein